MIWSFWKFETCVANWCVAAFVSSNNCFLCGCFSFASRVCIWEVTWEMHMQATCTLFVTRHSQGHWRLHGNTDVCLRVFRGVQVCGFHRTFGIRIVVWLVMHARIFNACPIIGYPIKSTGLWSVPIRMPVWRYTVPHVYPMFIHFQAPSQVSPCHSPFLTGNPHVRKRMLRFWKGHWTIRYGLWPGFEN